MARRQREPTPAEIAHRNFLRSDSVYFVMVHKSTRRQLYFNRDYKQIADCPLSTAELADAKRRAVEVQQNPLMEPEFYESTGTTSSDWIRYYLPNDNNAPW